MQMALKRQQNNDRKGFKKEDYSTSFEFLHIFYSYFQKPQSTT